MASAAWVEAMILNRSNDLSSDRALSIEAVECFCPLVSVDLTVVITIRGGQVYLSIKSNYVVSIVIKYTKIRNNMMK